jgi:hypothetical protein
MNYQPYVESVNPDGTLTRDEGPEIHLPLRLSSANLSRLSGLTLAGPSINTAVSVSGGGSDTTTGPMNTPPETPTISAGASEKAYSSGWETASDNADSICQGTQEQDGNIPSGVVAQTVHLGAISVPEHGERRYGAQGLHLTVACIVFIPYGGTLNLEGNAVLEQSIQIGDYGTLILEGSLFSIHHVKLGYQGVFEMKGDYQFFGSIELGDYSRLEFPSHGTCGNALSNVYVGYEGRFSMGGDLEAKCIQLRDYVVFKLAGRMECWQKLSLGYAAELFPSGYFKCMGLVDLGDYAKIEVGKDADFEGIVKIGYGARLEVRGDARFTGPIDLNANGTIAVKFGTFFPRGSVLNGSIEYL